MTTTEPTPETTARKPRKRHARRLEYAVEFDREGNTFVRIRSWDTRGTLTVRLYEVVPLIDERTGELTGWEFLGSHADVNGNMTRHHVCVSEFGPSCDCGDGTFRGSYRRCKHLVAGAGLGLWPLIDPPPHQD